MRYVHGHKPRNPYNMIIQENHAADKANLIISYYGQVLSPIISQIKPRNPYPSTPTSK